MLGCLLSQPFADPNAKKKYTQIAFHAHVLATARSLVGSTLFGICLTIGLHYYKGMVMGLAIQTIMAPLNLLENPLVKALFLGSSRSLRPEDRIFGEKDLQELSPDDEIVDEHGSTIVRRIPDTVSRQAKNTTATSSANAPSTSGKSFEEVLLDTWDSGSNADIGPLVNALTKKNVNYQTKEDQWTPLMILAGLGCKGSGEAIRKVVHELGANPATVDKDGWNALHWAAFHNSEEGARELCKERRLQETKDKEGLTPLETAKKEGNEKIAEMLEAALGESKKSK